MKSWTRELLFITEVPEVEASPKPKSRKLVAGQVRLWKSSTDIPWGTLVRPAEGGSHLYVTTRGLGWWMSPDSRGRFPEIDDLERRNGGWAMGMDQGRGPYLEVPQ